MKKWAANVCAICGQYGYVCDHHPTPLRTLLALGADPCNPADCRILCRGCRGKVDGASY
jgi:hypothetical protein